MFIEPFGKIFGFYAIFYPMFAYAGTGEAGEVGTTAERFANIACE